MNTRAKSQLNGSRRPENRHAVVLGGSLAAARAMLDRLRRQTRSALILGDAVCAFNPVYGQGMTIASLGAVTMQECLREQEKLHPNGNLTGLSRRFQKRLAKVNKAPWLLATGEDYRYRETDGAGPNAMTKFMHRYMEHVLRLATQSVAVRTILLRAFNILVPPAALFQPRVLFRVLVQALKPVRQQPVTRKPIGKQILYQSRG